MYLYILFFIIISNFLRSFGCVLFEMIKLERLFKQKTEYLLMKEIAEFDVYKELKDKNIEQFFSEILKR
jgi:hypothetical protein